MSKDTLGIYVHIPFCRYKCPYCDFFVHVEKREQKHADYIQTLLQETQLYAQTNLPDKPTLQTLYFGGGTPSFVNPKHIASVIKRLQRLFTFSKDIEISLEANPEDIEKDKVMAWKKMGINRITLGIQSIHPDEIKFLGRGHDQDSAFKAIDCLNQHGMHNIGLDLMYQLPDQNTESFVHYLDLLFEHPFKHISLYGLTIEDKTPFAKQVAAKAWIPLGEEKCQNLFFASKDYFLKKGFLQYEMSNFALPGFESKHNLRYWQQKPYWGIGVSAHSYMPMDQDAVLGHQRWWNPKNLKSYTTQIENQRYPFETELLSLEQSYIEKTYTHLRTTGLDLSDLYVFVGSKKTNLQHVIEQFVAAKDAVIQKNFFVLTDKGQLKADWITEEIIRLF